jgi:hypothetical protein
LPCTSGTTRQNIQGKLDFSPSRAGEAREAEREETESRPAVHDPERPASTNQSMEEVCGRDARSRMMVVSADIAERGRGSMREVTGADRS